MSHAPCRPIYFCLRFMETLKMNVVAETCTALIKKFLADPYVPKPKSCVFTAWHSQPYSRGSYTSIGVGGQQSHIEKMAEPLFQKPMNRTVNKATVCKCCETPTRGLCCLQIMLSSPSLRSPGNIVIRHSTAPFTELTSLDARPRSSC